MFGYIKPFREELKVVEDGLYRSIYCGLCRNMGKTISQAYRLTLNYDAVFLALIRLCASGEDVKINKGRCIVHPIKKRSYIIAPDTLSYCSRVFAVLADAKISDDIADSTGFKKIKAKIKKMPAKSFSKKAKLDSLSDKITEHLKKLSQYEKDFSSPLDLVADEFGFVLGYVFSFDTEGSISRILYDIGFHTGRWIYIIDAADDYYEDKKKGEFNPFASLDTLPSQSIEQCLNLELEMLSHSIDLLPEYQKGVRNIIENIIYLGMPDKAKKVLYKER